ADLVVRAPGNVRTVPTLWQVYNLGRGEVLSSSSGCRVTRVEVVEGARVKKDQEVIQLDTWAVDLAIAKQQEVIAAGEDQVQQLAAMRKALREQWAAAKDEAEAEWKEKKEQVAIEKDKRRIQEKYAEQRHETLKEDLQRLRPLLTAKAVSQ